MGEDKGGREVTEEGKVVGTYIGTYLRHKLKIYPKQIGGKWIATWTLTRPDGKQESSQREGSMTL